MRILSPCCGINPETNSGGEINERETLLALSRRRDCHLTILLARDKPVPEDLRSDVVRLPIRKGLRWWVMPFVMPRHLKEACRLGEVHVLRCHSVSHLGPACFRFRRWHRSIPIMATYHHPDIGVPGLISRLLLPRFDHVIAQSEQGRTELVSRYHVDPARISVIHPGHAERRFFPGSPTLDLRARYAIPEDGIVFLWLGGMKERKGLDGLMRAWSGVTQRRAYLLLAGSGPLLEGTMRLNERLVGPVRRPVIFAGFVSEQEKADFYRAADVFVWPSTIEGFGAPVIEAMASGLFVIATNTGVVPELVSRGAAIRVATGRLEWPHALERAAWDRLERARGAVNPAFVRDMTWDETARQTVAVYERLLR